MIKYQNITNNIKILKTPIKNADISNLKIGDIVFLEGTLVTCRDVAHRRVVELGIPLPIDVRDGAIFHAGPIVKEYKDKYEMVSVGPTTSMRMEKFEYDFIKKTGVKLIIGKGGMGSFTERACKEFNTIHLVYPAGNAVLAATQVKEIIDWKWQELGMPETLWICEVEKFGPMIVSIDTEGQNLFEEMKHIYNTRKLEILEQMYSRVKFIK